jgi:hypothetical protein
LYQIQLSIVVLFVLKGDAISAECVGKSVSHNKEKNIGFTLACCDSIGGMFQEYVLKWLLQHLFVLSMHACKSSLQLTAVASKDEGVRLCRLAVA